MKQSGVSDCASVGMKLPNGTYKSPITEDHLFWVRPGKYFYAVDTSERGHLQKPEIVRVCACLPTDCYFKLWSLTLTVLFLLFDLACLTETCSFECGLNDLFLLLKEAVKAVYGRQNRS